jgi:hypothetical protein
MSKGTDGLIFSVENIQEVDELKIFNVLAKCPKEIARGIKLPQ